MSSIQFEELTMYYTHGKNDMSNQNNCEWLYFQKPQRWYLKNFKSHSGASVSRQVSSLLRGLAAPFALWVALQSIQPGNLLSVKESLFPRKQVRWNSPEIGIEEHCIIYFIVTDEKKIVEQKGRREKYISLCCTFNRSYFVLSF